MARNTENDKSLHSPTSFELVQYNRTNLQYLGNASSNIRQHNPFARRNFDAVMFFVDSFVINLYYFSFVKSDHDADRQFLKYDIFDKKVTYKIPDRVYAWIQLPRNEKDMIEKFRTPYYKIYPTLYLGGGRLLLSSIDKVMTLFQKNEKHRLLHPSGMNALFAAFAGYWVHTFLHTWYKYDDAEKKLFPYQNNADLVASPIYGETIEQEAVFRRNQKGGRIRMRRPRRGRKNKCGGGGGGGGGLPLRIRDVSEEEARLFQLSNPYNNKDLFLCGFSRANVSVGTFVMHTLFQRNHNRICKKMRKIDPAFTANDEDAFQMAKTINLYHFIKIVLHDYISSIGGFDNVNLLKDVLAGSEFLSPAYLNFEAETNIPFEYNLVYQWHCLLPTHIDGVSLQDLAYNTDLFYRKSISEWVDKLSNTQCYTQHFRNCQPYLLPVERKTVEVCRNIRMMSYCEFMKKMHLSVPTTFLDITQDEWSAKKLQDVYHDVKNVELYIGMNSEKVTPPFFFSSTQNRILILIAIRYITFVTHKLREYILRMNADMIQIVDTFNYIDEFISANCSGDHHGDGGIESQQKYSFRV